MTETHPGISVDAVRDVAHVVGDRGVAWPEPDLEELAVTFHGVEASADRVESGAVVVLSASRLDAAAVVSLAVEVSSAADHGTAVRGHGASRAGVESDLVVGVLVDTFDLPQDD